MSLESPIALQAVLTYPIHLRSNGYKELRREFSLLCQFLDDSDQPRARSSSIGEYCEDVERKRLGFGREVSKGFQHFDVFRAQ